MKRNLELLPVQYRQKMSYCSEATEVQNLFAPRPVYLGSNNSCWKHLSVTTAGLMTQSSISCHCGNQVTK